MPPITQHLLLISGSIAALFGSSELLFHSLHIRGEWTRKYVHLVTGIIILLLPRFFDSHWWVLAMCVPFGICLWFSQRQGWLPSIHRIGRESKGAWLYPVSVYVVFWVHEKVFQHDLLAFYLPVLILAISDPLAAITGKQWPKGPYRIGRNDVKTLAGSAAFFLSALAVSLAVPALLHSPLPLVAIPVIALAATVAEALSRNGYDNLSIPLTVMGVLYGTQQAQAWLNPE